MTSTQRSSWVLFHFFVLFVVSYALGVFFLHITVSLCKYKVNPKESSGSRSDSSTMVSQDGVIVRGRSMVRWAIEPVKF